jgi:transcriptional regulator
VSKRLAVIEGRIGVALVNRTTRRMTADDATQDAIAQAIGCKRSNVSLIRRDMRRRAEMVAR